MSKIEDANDVVVQSGYKYVEKEDLISGATAANGNPSAASDGVACGTYGGIIVVKPASGDSCDVNVWLYFSDIGWVRCIELDKTGIDSEGNCWKAKVGGASRIYVELDTVSATTGIDAYFLRSYT